MSKKGKPFGIVVLAIWAAFSGFILLPIGFLLLIGSQIDGGSGLLFGVGGMVILLLGVLILAAMYGLWTLQEWGRISMFWLSVVFIPLGIISIFPVWPEQEMSLGNTVLQVVGIVINLLIIYYLLRPRIREVFFNGG